MYPFIGAAFIILSITGFLAIVISRVALSRKIPPGPSHLTRLLDDQGRNEPLALKFMRWNQLYGNVVSVMDFVHLGKPAIVLGSLKAASDLLEKKGNIYSSRPRNILGGEIAARHARGIFMPMGSDFRRFRTLMNVTLGIETSKSFRVLEDLESKVLMYQIISEDSRADADYHNIFKRCIYSVTFFVTYGYRVPSLSPEAAKSYDEFEKWFLKVVIPGRHLVDHFPILLRLPKCLQWFRKEAEERGEYERQTFLSYMSKTREILAKGEMVSCAASRGISKQKEYGLSDEQLSSIAAAPFSAGVVTTFETLRAFILAMTLYPDVVKKAQHEIDSLVDVHRMPNIEDGRFLPYVQAIVKETLRWHPLIPTGVPHAVVQDDFYDGMFIPKGSTVFANIYGITRNPEIFPEPEEFKPERFLNNEDPFFKNYNLTFGFGRRICPGRYVALDLLFLLVARILWAFDIVGKNPEIPQLKTGHPKPFSYTLVPRSKAVATVITEDFLQVVDEAKQWE